MTCGRHPEMLIELGTETTPSKPATTPGCDLELPVATLNLTQRRRRYGHRRHRDKRVKAE
jgi:hypothetical protein